ncbi:nucleotidyltransferase domain-containing protein [Methylococcus sp. EFPC2]|uniref:type VII toxin-antitoxin system MntA family adenylyltransferase antitoxin n=1 Tax=Methylococcus sp. EFPC2 TaxID=2812648 RepID=UPI001967CD18|nr:nucleotidyltransferase domain-containing protein [Methylococcus sp. EFPC2]QSA96815.1 hypothetical protein JWZ97_16650 [Methylococcus sp. EFPC2]
MQSDKLTEMVKICQILAEFPRILFAVLVGSRADGRAKEQSDWDIAVQWRYGEEPLDRIAEHESLRNRLAHELGVIDSKIDLIDLSSVRLAMKALVAEEGRLLVANDELAWSKFLTRTWRELEDFYWERTHAA